MLTYADVFGGVCWEVRCLQLFPGPPPVQAVGREEEKEQVGKAEEEKLVVLVCFSVYYSV